MPAIVDSDRKLTPKTSLRVASGLVGTLVLAAVIGSHIQKPPSTVVSALLVAGCWLLVGAAVPWEPVARSAFVGRVPALVMYLLATAIFWSAVICTGVIAAFGQAYPTERLCFVLIALVTPAVSLAALLRAGAAPPGIPSRSARAPEHAVATDPLVLSASATLALTAAALLAVRLAHAAEASLLLTILLLVGRPVLSLVLRVLGHVRDLPSPSGALPVLAAFAGLAFIPSGGATVGRIAVALVAAVLVAVAVHVTRGRSGGPRLRLVCDVLVVALVLLAVCQLTPINTYRVLNQNYFLGPVNDLLHGRLMLVGTFSQYGVGMFYALGAVLSAATPGYGSLTLLLAVGTALLFGCMYLLLRLALRSQVIAIAGVVSAAFIYIYNIGTWQYLDTPSTGVLRFGLPWLVGVTCVAAARAVGPARQRQLRALALALVASAAIWSAETAMYSVGAAGAVVLVTNLSVDAPLRLRLKATVRELLLLAAVVVAAIATLSLLTLAVAGQFPDWGPYIAFLRLYTLSTFGLLPIEHWSQGLVVGALYGASVAAVIGLLVICPETVRRRLTAFSAIAATTAMGGLEFTYFLGRAAPSNLIWVSPPAVVLMFLWIGTLGGLMGRSAPRVLTAAAVALFAALLVIGARPYMSFKFEGSALGAIIESKPSLSSAIQQLSANPAINPVSVEVVRLVESPPFVRRDLALIAYPPVESEALLRAGRANSVGVSNPCQAALSESAADRVRRDVQAFPLGGRLVVVTDKSLPILLIQSYELQLMQARFRLRLIVHRGNLDAYAPVAVRGTWHGGSAFPQPPVPAPGAGCA